MNCANCSRAGDRAGLLLDAAGAIRNWCAARKQTRSAHDVAGVFKPLFSDGLTTVGAPLVGARGEGAGRAAPTFGYSGHCYLH
jgi:hypothetical protein